MERKFFGRRQSYTANGKPLHCSDGNCFINKQNKKRGLEVISKSQHVFYISFNLFYTVQFIQDISKCNRPKHAMLMPPKIKCKNHDLKCPILCPSIPRVRGRSDLSSRRMLRCLIKHPAGL